MRKHLTQNIKALRNSFKNGSFSTGEVTACALEESVKLKDLNAFIHLTPELALQRAKLSDHQYSKKTHGPLEGITIALKDNFCTKDIPTTCASKMLKDFVPPYNATVYERLVKAGAILIGKTNMDEFAMGSGTVDSIYGPAKNCWSEDLSENNWRITGGSSGGSALAVASGICYANHFCVLHSGRLAPIPVVQTRNPAAYCGVVGLKPTYGLVSRHGLIPLVNSMDVPGIFTRCISDCVDVLNVVAGPDHFDSTTLKQPFTPITLPEPDQINLKNIRIGIPKEYYCEGLSAEVLDTWRKIADLLEVEGAQVKQVSLPYTAASIFVYSILNQCEVASNMARYDGIEHGHRSDTDSSTEELYAKTRAEGFNNVVKTRILAGNYFLLRQNYDIYFEKALKVRRLILEDFQRVFETGTADERVDVLLTPTTLTDAPLYKDFSSASNRDQCAVQDFCTQPANMAGIPALSMPIRLSSQGMPIGLQLMSNNLNEQMLLTVARWIEAQVDFNSLMNMKLLNLINK